MKIHPPHSKRRPSFGYSSQAIETLSGNGEIRFPDTSFGLIKRHLLSITPCIGEVWNSLTVQVEWPAIRMHHSIALKNPFHPLHLVFGVQYWKMAVDGRTLVNAFLISYSNRISTYSEETEAQIVLPTFVVTLFDRTIVWVDTVVNRAWRGNHLHLRNKYGLEHETSPGCLDKEWRAPRVVGAFGSAAHSVQASLFCVGIEIGHQIGQAWVYVPRYGTSVLTTSWSHSKADGHQQR